MNRKSAQYFSQNIDNAGHTVNEENPKTLARVLDEYYDGK